MTPAAFDARVDKSGDCWIWTGHRKTDGYGLVGNQYAHRFAYERWNGPIPPRACVLHECDNRLCVRPEHLHLGRRKDNSAEMVFRGRSLRGERHPNAVLSDEEVAAVHVLRAVGWSQERIAAIFNVSRSAIGLIVTGKRRSA